MKIENFSWDILANIIATCIFWFIGGLIVWLTQKRKMESLYKFFGLKSSPIIYIYFSSLPVREKTLQNKYGGFNDSELRVVGVEEFQLIALIAEHFNLNKRFLIPDIFIGLVDYFFFLKKPKIEFHCAPSKEEKKSLPEATIICLGSSNYNDITSYCNDQLKPFAKFELYNNNELGVRTTCKSREQYPPQLYKNENQHDDLAVLEKYVDGKTTIFVAAGTSSNGTVATAKYLLKNWTKLQEEYGEKKFALVFRGESFKHNPNGSEPEQFQTLATFD